MNGWERSLLSGARAGRPAGGVDAAVTSAGAGERRVAGGVRAGSRGADAGGVDRRGSHRKPPHPHPRRRRRI